MGVLTTRAGRLVVAGLICLLIGPIAGILFGSGNVAISALAVLLLLAGAIVVVLGAVLMVLSAMNAPAEHRARNR